MNRIILTGLLLAATLSASATTFYEQLCEFNFNWKKYSMVAPKGEARTFDTDADYVQAHLSCVIPILRTNPTDHLSADQQLTRSHLIELLDGYRLAKTFPLNHYRHERIPVFIDEHGTHCAVGYLMMKSGYENLAQRISAADNYVWVKDITDPEAIAWQEYSGFTMEELKLIQGAYDWYPPNAWVSPDKFETPQMPICTTAYFDETYGQNTVNYGYINIQPIYSTVPQKTTTKPAEKKKDEKFVWCKGEGNGKVINGKWEQNYGPGLPWIKGFFVNGQRSGDWEEYYPGTQTLCRTESWRNNKLNGVRKRFDRASRLIEEIIFVEGKAICKTNYDLNDSTAYVRIPENDSIVLTKVYNKQGQLIAIGKEQIYNPSGLLWFQNIELTAMNSIQVSARSTQIATGSSNGTSFGASGGYNTGSNEQIYSIRSLFNGGSQPSLVEYHKIGTWLYYAEAAPAEASAMNHSPLKWSDRFQHYGSDLAYKTAMFKNVNQYARYDSLMVDYDDDYIVNLYGYGKYDYVHYSFYYYTAEELLQQYVSNYYTIDYLMEHYGAEYGDRHQMKTAGQYNVHGERIGTWYQYNTSGQAYLEQNYLYPIKEEQLEIGKPTAKQI